MAAEGIFVDLFSGEPFLCAGSAAEGIPAKVIFRGTQVGSLAEGGIRAKLEEG